MILAQFGFSCQWKLRRLHSFSIWIQIWSKSCNSVAAEVGAEGARKEQNCLGAAVWRRIFCTCHTQPLSMYCFTHSVSYFLFLILFLNACTLCTFRLKWEDWCFPHVVLTYYEQASNSLLTQTRESTSVLSLQEEEGYYSPPIHLIPRKGILQH